MCAYLAWTEELGTRFLLQLLPKLVETTSLRDLIKDFYLNGRKEMSDELKAPIWQGLNKTATLMPESKTISYWLNASHCGGGIKTEGSMLQ